ncbi:MAG: uncharacterized protein KVP18_002454 [Porospora cf. gigantea A]|uniref:uncharacterized protein n=1 Tax=Porospora cf. gigantea A TaxID=2853593 RepID=UPI003559D3AD|nr:MAG: hypothetical protein KVP18_002454 [Porospora cf. gigantea A]
MLAYVITHFEKSIEVYLECRHAEKTKLCIDVPQLLDDSPFSGLEAESLRRPPAKQTSALSEYSTRRQESPPVHIDVSAKSFLINPIAAIKTVYRGVPAWKSLAPDAFEAMWSFLFDHLNEWKVLSSKLGETDTKKVREKGLRDIGLDPEFVSAYLSGLVSLSSHHRSS